MDPPALTQAFKMFFWHRKPHYRHEREQEKPQEGCWAIIHAGDVGSLGKDAYGENDERWLDSRWFLKAQLPRYGIWNVKEKRSQKWFRTSCLTSRKIRLLEVFMESKRGETGYQEVLLDLYRDSYKSCRYRCWIRNWIDECLKKNQH